MSEMYDEEDIDIEQVMRAAAEEQGMTFTRNRDQTWFFFGMAMGYARALGIRIDPGTNNKTFCLFNHEEGTKSPAVDRNEVRKAVEMVSWFECMLRHMHEWNPMDERQLAIAKDPENAGEILRKIREEEGNG